MNTPSKYRVAFEIGEEPAAVPGPRTRINVDPHKVEQGLLKLVLALVELIRQLLEKQAVRRMEAGSLSPTEIDRLGGTLMQLEAKIRELQRQFEIDDLNINLGPLGNLLDQ
ncbi:MAG: gas vesicle protein K [Acidobacteriota bacterium]